VKEVIYLVQGRSDLVKEYYHLQVRENADAIFLTYDRKIDGAIYFPDSTWAEGRNKLLAAAAEKGEYLYFIFCDDDIEFEKGNWDEYEKLLLRYKPAIGCPVFPRTKKTKIRFLIFQVFLVNDEQMIALHRDVINDFIIFPLQTCLDKIHWWSSCFIQQILIHNFYRYNSLQFNNIEILNNEHNRYDNSNKEIYKKESNKWLAEQFAKSYNKLTGQNNYNVMVKIKALIFTIRFFVSRKLKPASYRISKKKLLKSLKKDSILIKQYNQFNSKTL